MRGSGSILVRARRLAVGAPLAWLALSGSPVLAAENPHTGAGQPLDSLVQNYCVSCHNAEDWAGSLALDTLDLAQVGQEPEVWESTVGKLRGRLMPPAGEKQPSQGEIDSVVRFLETSLDTSADKNHIGHVPIQRLNRIEFAATIKALIGVDIDPRQALPTEVEVEGFSNIAEALAVSPSFMEQYLSAVRRAVRLAIGEPVPKMAKVFITASAARPSAYPLGTRANAGSGRGPGMSFTHVFPADGEYRFNVTEEDNVDIGLYPRGAENPATMVILVDGVEVGRKEFGGGEWLDIADRDGAEGKKKILSMISTPTKVKAGKRDVVVTFIDRARALSNDATIGGGGFGGGGGRIGNMPMIQTGIEIEGPFAPKGLSMNESRAKIFVCQPKATSEERACAERIARDMATRAFRRPATDGDVQFLMKFYDMGRQEQGGFDAGITELVTATLSSPDFLYRVIPSPTRAGETRLLSGLELATRLSFFLWNTPPDRELIDLAAAGKLSDAAAMNAQVDRMMKDPRASTLVDNFALAWLNLDELDQVEPTDRAFTPALRNNFETEIRMFLSSVLLENRSVIDLLDANWTFVNQDLAGHYGIQGVRGSAFRRVVLENENRFGLLGKGAVLLRTSYADRTSPVVRGAWVLDRIVGTPPSPPPPGVETDLSIHDGQAPTTIRARLEAHRQNPTCMACHGLIDPPGLALENFDNTGRWRDVDAAARVAIDSTTVLTSGVKLNGPVELRRHLMAREDQFPTTVTTRLMMYALNREVDYFDMPVVRNIVSDAKASRYTFGALVKGVVNSDAFRRQGAEEKKQTVASTAGGNAAVAKNP
jgi:mono/diheme cytochrome c family protein